MLRFGPRVLWTLLVIVFFAGGFADARRLALTYLACYFLVAALMVFVVRGQLYKQWVPRIALWRPMLRYGLPISMGVAPRLLNARLDQLLMAGMLPTRVLGLYIVAVGVANLAAIPAIAMSTVAFSKIAGMPEVGARLAFIRRATLAVVAITGGTALALAALAWPVLRLFGEEFVEAVPIVRIVLISMVLQGVARIIQTGLQGTGRTVAVMVAHWAGFAALVPTILVLIPRYGLSGAAWALVGSAAVSFVISVGLALRRPPMQLP